MLKTVIVYERPEALEVKLITKFLDEFIISLFLAEAIKIQIILCQRLLFCKQFAVCREIKPEQTPLGTKGRTSILSFREYCASCGASFSVSRKRLHDRECFVTSFRQGGYTPLHRLCGYPLCTCRPQTVLRTVRRQQV